MRAATAVRRNAVVVMATSLLLAGCINVDLGRDGVRQVQLVLEDARPATAARAAPLAPALVIQPAPGDPLADTTAIAYSRTPGERAFYQLATWHERPVRALPRLLQQRLESRGSFGAIALIGQPIQSDWLLAIAIDTIYHDVQSEPGSARLVVRAELIDRQARRLVARRLFSASVPVAEANSTAAAAAFGRGLADILDALVPWIEQQTAAVMAKPPSG